MTVFWQSMYLLFESHQIYYIVKNEIHYESELWM